ncbi:MAG: twin-arginine translocation signal domain-containing protein [Spirochaetaceae bacterium]|nr:MAG: twin-arginine translocation signal domain-containing protein [Spirochaetaceae bacterium]
MSRNLENSPRKHISHPDSSRRSFLKTLGQIAAAAGLGLLGFSIFRKSSFTQAVKEKACTGSWICRNCGRVNLCGYPEALSYRTAGRKG